MEQNTLNNQQKTLFEKKIMPILEYVGIIGASLTTIAYFVVVYVLIRGFEVHDIIETTVFAIVNAMVGFIIMQFLKVQGVSFAKNLPRNKAVIAEYNKLKSKGPKKPHSIAFYWVTSVIKDILIKAGSVALTSVGLIYIVIKGNEDYNLFFLAAINLILFICFGLLSLNKAYETYNNEHIPYIMDKINTLRGDDHDKN